MNQIRVGKQIIPMHKYLGFIDSGTTTSYFPNEIYNSIINNFKSICNNIPNKKCGNFKNIPGLGYCGFFNTTEDKEKALEEYWPNITLLFEGHNYTLRGIDYSIDYNEREVGACLGFEGVITYKITLGGTLMHNHDIIFDKDNQRIGFAAADCNRKNFKGNNNNRNVNLNNIVSYLILSFLIIILIISLIIIFIRFKNLYKKNGSQKFHPQIDDTSQTQKKGIDIIEIK